LNSIFLLPDLRSSAFICGSSLLSSLLTAHCPLPTVDSHDVFVDLVLTETRAITGKGRKG
jgi:hypothetical protein